MNIETAEQRGRVPWGNVLLSAISAVSWALIAMAGTAALGLHLLEADATASLGPMTAAVVVLGAGGSVTPSGDVSAFGLKGAEAATAVEIAPLGVGLVGAVLLSWFFLRSLRGAGAVISPSELLARAGAVTALFVATLGGLAWAGHDVITIDGGALGLDDLPGTGGGGGSGGGGIDIPGLGDISGLLPDRVGDLIDAKAAVGFTVDTLPTLLGGLVWAAGVLTIALLASRRTPLPRGWETVHRVVRPAASALVTVALVAVAAGFAAAGYAAIGDAHPKRIAGAALLGAPNGVWLGVTIGLFVPFDGSASGVLVNVLPDPLDRLLSSADDQSVSLGRLAELDSRVWLLGVAAALMMLLAGILAAARTPLARGVAPDDVGARVPLAVRDPGALRFAGRCALRLGVVTAVALPLVAWLAEVSVDASISVLGFDAFGAGIELRGQLVAAVLLGAVWGAGAGAVGALLAYVSGAAGWRAVPLALGDVWTGGDVGAGAHGAGAARGLTVAATGEGEAGYGVHEQVGGRGPYAGPYAPGSPYRPPNRDTNPYLRLPGGLVEPEDARPAEAGQPYGSGWGPDGRSPYEGGRAPDAPSTEARSPDRSSAPESAGSGEGEGEGEGPPENLYGLPTMARPLSPPPRRPGRRGGSSSGPVPEKRTPPPPPPPPAPPPPGTPKGRR
ncbi:streptophobe family protein [Streptomyces sp. WI04-05B]|uniref:streptophobe family protein n=1 Tax=Streptomyces TaxID=1883 RepID=UPI0029BDBCE9|nr:MULTISPECIES: streptophobe family protein [unclassified Streptomyces]MDX2541021.1 streptophobe family protein [Streptomyces sp. WI04-05B]MDX2585749.1 streptophobe family protein [Streptomyces sp. WI04-05A]MDX3752262.1 streptophobe family protein [Streptomyces sp. AK08-02]